MKHVYTLVIALSISASFISTSDKTSNTPRLTTASSLNVSGTVDMVVSGHINVGGTVDVSIFTRNATISLTGIVHTFAGALVAKEAAKRMFRADPPRESLNSSENYPPSSNQGALKQFCFGMLWSLGGFCFAMSPYF